MAGRYLRPLTYKKHHGLVVAASLLKSHGHRPTLENLKRLAEVYPETGLTPDEVDELCSAMPGTVECTPRGCPGPRGGQSRGLAVKADWPPGQGAGTG